MKRSPDATSLSEVATPKTFTAQYESPSGIAASVRWFFKYWIWKSHGEVLMRRQNMEIAKPPVFIGATGGSGTRVVARVLQHAGFYVGANHNFACDAMDFAPFVVKWLPRYLQSNKNPLSKREQRLIRRDLEIAVVKFRNPMLHADQLWAAKAPRFIYLLPLLHASFPGMKFMHVIRDGRDMAFAPNQSQLNDYGSIYLDDKFARAPQPVRSIALWCKANLQASEYGEKQLREHYLLLRFEDLCNDPQSALDRIFAFLGNDGANRDAAMKEVVPQPTIGRWRKHDPALLSEMHEIAAPALLRFGYLSAQDEDAAIAEDSSLSSTSDPFRSCST